MCDRANHFLPLTALTNYCGSIVIFSLLPSELNNSSSTLASSEGDMDSKNEDTLGSLDSPLLEGTGQDGGEGEAEKDSGGVAEKKQNLALNSEITTINLRLVLPGVSQPVEVTVCHHLSVACRSLTHPKEIPT